MDRREFLRGGAVAGVAGVVVGAGGVGGSLREKARSTRIHERADFGGTSHGSATVVWSVPTEEDVVAVTFDDGPHPRLTPRVLDMLADHDVRATFFLIGSAAERHPSLVRRILDEGHEVGNHSWSHPHMAYLGPDEARDEVLRGGESLARLIGHQPRWFRPPRGILSGSILRAAKDIHQEVAMWSARPPVGSLDQPTRQITDHLLSALRPGTIYGLHDGTSGREHEEDMERRRERELPACAQLLAGLIERGYTLRTLSDLAGGSALA